MHIHTRICIWNCKYMWIHTHVDVYELRYTHIFLHDWIKEGRWATCQFPHRPVISSWNFCVRVCTRERERKKRIHIYIPVRWLGGSGGHINATGRFKERFVCVRGRARLYIQEGQRGEKRQKDRERGCACVYVYVKSIFIYTYVGLFCRVWM